MMLLPQQTSDQLAYALPLQSVYKNFDWMTEFTMPHLISPEQGAFISGCLIIDNILLA